MVRARRPHDHMMMPVVPLFELSGVPSSSRRRHPGSRRNDRLPASNSMTSPLEASDVDVPLVIPRGLVQVCAQGLTNLSPWQVMDRDLAKDRSTSLRTRTRRYIPSHDAWTTTISRVSIRRSLDALWSYTTTRTTVPSRDVSSLPSRLDCGLSSRTSLPSNPSRRCAFLARCTEQTVTLPERYQGSLSEVLGSELRFSATRLRKPEERLSLTERQDLPNGRTPGDHPRFYPDRR